MLPSAHEPPDEELLVGVGLVDEGHVAGTVEELPNGVRHIVGHCLGYQRRTLVVRSADDEGGVGNLAQTVGIVEIAESACRGVLVRSPGGEDTTRCRNRFGRRKHSGEASVISSAWRTV